MTNYDRAYLGIDYGEKRIGVAKSDPTGLIASPLMTIEVKSLDQAAKAIVALIEEWDIRKIVIGYPLLPSGDKSAICERVDSFIERLHLLHPIEIVRADEQYSSQEAADIIHAHGKKIGQDKKRVDRIAAVLILQRYLDEHPAG
jgi:putative Holliday junction resolvase